MVQGGKARQPGLSLKGVLNDFRAGLLGISAGGVSRREAVRVGRRNPACRPAMVRKNRQKHATFERAGMNRTERKSFHRTDKLMNPMLVFQNAGAGIALRVGPRPVRYPSDHWAVPPQRRLGRGILALAEFSQTVRGSQKNEAPAAKQSLCLEAALVQGVRQSREAAGACKHDHLLANFQAFKHETEILGRSFLPANDKLARCGQRRHSSDRPESNPHGLIMHEVADQCQRHRFSAAFTIWNVTPASARQKVAKMAAPQDGVRARSLDES